MIIHLFSISWDFYGMNTGTKEFRNLVSEIAMLIVYEATRSLPLFDVKVKTPCGIADCKVISGRKLAFVPILRAGTGMLDGALALVPAAKVGHIGLYRNEENMQPVDITASFPQTLRNVTSLSWTRCLRQAVQPLTQFRR